MTTTTEAPRSALDRKPAQMVLGTVSKIAPGFKPKAQKLLIRGGYAVVNRWLNEIGYGCMNYGYAPLDADASALQAQRSSDEQFSLALYERVAGAHDIAGKQVLEVGCGRGGGAAFVAERFNPAKLTGLDFSEKAIEFAQRRHTDPRLAFVRGDAEQLPFADASMDAVVNVESSHCYPDVPRFFAEAFRVLRPGGALLFADLRLADQIDDLRQQFLTAGYEIAEEERITDNVVRALELDSPRRQELVNARVPRALRSYVINFIAGEGSEVQESLRSGSLEYVRFALRKPAAA
jgi:SAM-dependent methyltransferase